MAKDKSNKQMEQTVLPDSMYRGYFPLWRKITEWGWYKDSNTKAVFIHLLLSANFKERHYLGHSVLPGQCVTGRKTLSVTLGLTEMQIRTALKHLKATNEITIKAHTKFSIITLLNFQKYLPQMPKNNQQDNQQVTNKQPTSNQQITTPYNDNNDKNVKNDKNTSKPEKIKYLDYVLLTVEEHKKLNDLLGRNLDNWIDRLNDYIGSKGKSYKSHYHTILTWFKKDQDKGNFITTEDKELQKLREEDARILREKGLSV